MAPPAVPPRQFIVDQYGVKYYSTEATVPTRASVAPVARRAEPELMYERVPSRQSVAYMPQPPQYDPYDPTDSTMPPPPPPRRQIVPEHDLEYVDANGYPQRSYSTRPEQPVRYVGEPASPVYQYVPQQAHMAPPPPPLREPTSSTYRYVSQQPHMASPQRMGPTSPVYQQYPQEPRMMAPPLREPTSPVYAPRAYSVRPDPSRQDIPQGYISRQASVAPVQYVRYQDPAPPQVRAVSVMPGSEYGAPHQLAYGYAPRYVEERELQMGVQPVEGAYERAARQASVYRYE